MPRNVSASGRIAVFASLLAGLLAFTHPVFAQDRPIRILVGFAPGGTADIVARQIADKMKDSLGQPVIVDNRAGAAGRIALETLKNSPADGTFLALSPIGSAVVSPHAYKTNPFDTLKDFAPVTKLGDATLILVAHPSLPAKTLQEMIQIAKTRPLAYGTSGTGGTPHLAGELLKQRTGAQLEHIPYKGGGPAVTDVVGGQIPLVFTAVASAQQYVRTNRLVGLGVPGAKRSSSLPEVPTFQESGLDGFDVSSWTGIFAPAATPRPIVERLQKELAVVLQSAFVKERYAVLGIEPVGNSPDAFAAQVRDDLARWEKVVKAANVRVE